MTVLSLSTPDLDLSEALRFWYDRTNYEHRQALPNDLKLDRMRLLLARLGNPHQRLRLLHVAGTKGKGSTSAMLASILQQAGYRIGLFTSPHLHDVRERFCVDGQPITSAELAILLDEIRQACDVVPDATFFEIATAVGFLHFVRRRVDAAVLEVGLGGRFDSTNVCLPEVALITSISFDHTRQLGNTLAAIAFEKAGIVKRGRPTVSGVVVPEARAVIERVCAERDSRLFELDRDFQIDFRPGQVTATGSEPAHFSVRTPRRSWTDLELNLLGRHQAVNAAVALTAIEVLQGRGWAIHDTAIRRGLARVEWPGRLEILRRTPLLVVDCAHNVASAQAVVQALAESFPQPSPTSMNPARGSTGRRWLLLAVSNDKDVAGIVRVLAPHFHAVVVTRYSANNRAVATDELVAHFANHGHAALACESVSEAWEELHRQAGPDDLICATGSHFLVGELRALIG